MGEYCWVRGPYIWRAHNQDGQPPSAGRVVEVLSQLCFALPEEGRPNQMGLSGVCVTLVQASRGGQHLLFVVHVTCWRRATCSSMASSRDRFPTQNRLVACKMVSTQSMGRVKGRMAELVQFLPPSCISDQIDWVFEKRADPFDFAIRRCINKFDCDFVFGWNLWEIRFKGEVFPAFLAGVDNHVVDVHPDLACKATRQLSLSLLCLLARARSRHRLGAQEAPGRITSPGHGRSFSSPPGASSSCGRSRWYMMRTGTRMCALKGGDASHMR